MKLFYKVVLVVSFFVFLTHCARIGSPTGGEKDQTAPIMVMANPPYQSTNFSGKKIKLSFDEYIVLRNLNKQLIISPPLSNLPIITPQGTASKSINIKFTEKLAPQTTYTFNFGNAIQDNNENNKLESFKYVFSTGNKIDSLTFKGKVADVLLGKPLKNSNVLLYRIDSTFNDSIIYKQKPNYVAITKDSLNFKFSNLREGKYMVVALNEPVSDYIFNPKEDKIAYLKEVITLPQDSILKNSLQLFKEQQPFTFKRATNVSKGKIQFRYIGKPKELKVKLLSKTGSDFKTFEQFEKDKDTLNYWFTPIKKVDSLVFKISNSENFTDTVTVRLRKKKLDSLTVTSLFRGSINVNDTLFLETNNPITKLDNSLFSLTDKDTLAIKHNVVKHNPTKIAVLFKQSPKNKYTLKILPKAVIDLFKTTNDTLSFNFYTKDIEDFGNINLTLNNKTGSPLIIDVMERNKVLKTKYVSKNQTKVSFSYLLPKVYKIRATIDKNENKKWDTGNYLNKTQPEKIIYLSESITLRPNWTVENTFAIE